MIDYLNPDYSDVPGRRARPSLYRPAPGASGPPDVAVLTPFYNTDAIFEETAQSLLAQSMQNWEWIIVDDGSTDAQAIARLDAVAARDSRIRVVRQANAGPASARNTAYGKARARYVCLLDSDDLLEPTYLEKAVWFLDSHPEFAFCNSYSVFFGDQQFLWTSGFERGRAYLDANSGPPISVIRYSAYGECGGFDESICFGHEDWDFWLAMAKAGHWGYTIREFLQWYRKRSNGRFEQLMRTSGANGEFERTMKSKYEGLAQRFPAPVRRQPQPYDNVPARARASNPLAPNTNGRRILFLLPWMVTGGADRVNLDLVEGLTSRGHDVTICATLDADHRWAPQFARFTPDIFALPNFLNPTDYPRFLSYLIASRQIDTVIVTGSTLGYQLLPYLRAVAPDVAFVDLSHVEEPHWLNGGHPRFGVGYQGALDLNITTTAALTRWMAARGADPQRMRVLYTGVRIAARDAESARAIRRQVRAELGIAEDVPVIVFAGRICEQKRPALLARILKGARDAGLQFKAIIIGDGELRDELHDLLRQYRIARDVVSLHAIPHARWLQVLTASDVLLMPSQYEGISIALLEAMAAGVVPLVAQVGGQDEVVSAGAGVLVPHGPDELGQYVENLSLLLRNAELRGAMARRAAEQVATRFSWPTMIDNFLSILDEAHTLRRTAPRPQLTEQLGIELATQALELRRVNDAVSWLWSRKPEDTAAANEPVGIVAISPEAQPFVRIAILFSRTRVGRWVARDQNLRRIGRRLVRWMIARPV